MKKYDLQESYNNFKIKLKISFVNRAPGVNIRTKIVSALSRVRDRKSIRPMEIHKAVT